MKRDAGRSSHAQQCQAAFDNRLREHQALHGIIGCEMTIAG